MTKTRKLIFVAGLATLLTFLSASFVYAFSEGGGEEAGHGSGMAIIFFWIAIILILAKVSGLVEKFGQPAVLGELVLGVVLGNLGLVGLHWFDAVSENEILLFLSELGVVVLLFQVGLESNVTELKQVGMQAFSVAIVGVVLPFVLGTYLVGPYLMPGFSNNTYLFLGAALTATSVGITARVFRDLGKLQSSEAKIVLGAAVIDDVLGLIVLAVVSAIVQSGSVSYVDVGWIITKAVLFLGGTLALGQYLAPLLSQTFSKINPGIGMKFTLALGSALVMAYLAEFIGLAPIVGAFAAGLVFEPIHFRSFKEPKIIDDIEEKVQQSSDGSLKEDIKKILDKHSHHHIEELIEPVGYVLVPIFFVMTGMAVRLESLFDSSILLVALGFTIVAILGKIVSGWVAGKGVSHAIIGWGMVPRGEVGLIFAAIGRSLGVVNDDTFAVIIFMVIVTTLITPPMLTYLLRRL